MAAEFGALAPEGFALVAVDFRVDKAGPTRKP
jgi:hypothetical protein